MGRRKRTVVLEPSVIDYPKGRCGKVMFPSKKVGRVVARRAETRGQGSKKGRMDVYHCGPCDAWHIGHPKGSWRLRDETKESA